MGVKLNTRYKYGQLVSLLDLPRLSGNKQKKQLKEIGKQYLIEKEDGYYILKKKLDEIGAIEQQTYHKTRDYLTPMIYTLLSSSTTNVLELDMKDLLEILACVNNNYFIAKWHMEQTDFLLTNKNESGLSMFIQDTEPMVRRAVRDILKDMEDKQLIKLQEIPMFAQRYKTEQGHILTKTFQVDDETQYPVFLEAKRLALKEVGVENWSDLNFNQHRKVKHLIEDYLKKHLDVDYFYYKYKIILNKSGIESLITDRYRDFKVSFNKYMQNKIMSSNARKISLLTDEERKIYTDALIDISTKLDLAKEIRILEEKENE